MDDRGGDPDGTPEGRDRPPAPRLLSRSTEPAPRLDHLRRSDTVQAVHRRWAEMHRGDLGGGSAAPGAPPTGVRGRAKSMLRRAAGEAARSAIEADRALLGDLVRAVDALAVRADELSDRLGQLEHLVHEAVVTLSEDSVAIRARMVEPSITRQDERRAPGT